LNGWKEISAYLGKSVRTVQRWEKDLALPIHRIHGTVGEIVFALTAEIDQWQALTPAVQKQDVQQNGQNGDTHEAGNGFGMADAGPAAVAKTAEAVRAWRVATMGMLLLTLVATAGWAWTLWVASGHAPRVEVDKVPARFRVTESRLMVLNDAEEELWSRPIAGRMDPTNYSPEQRQTERMVAFRDLDGDGQREVLFLAMTNANSERTLYVFEGDGTLRFSHRAGYSLQVGPDQHGPPWNGNGFFMTTNDGGTSSIWFHSVHHTWFSSVLEKLDHQGRVLDTYWSNGHVETLRESTFNGRRVVLVGATNNDFVAGSLAVLDYDHPSGSAPSLNLKYSCRTCPAGQPVAYYVFPMMENARVTDSRPMVSEIKVDGAGNVLLGVNQARWTVPASGEALYGGVFYGLAADGRVVNGETSDRYRQEHVMLETMGLLDHGFGLACEKKLYPVLRWNGSKFVPQTGRLSAPPRTQAAHISLAKTGPRLSPASLPR
jgi:hypothetical protein